MGYIKRLVIAMERIATAMEKQKTPAENFKALISEAMNQQSINDYSIRQTERNKQIKEKYDYLKWRIESGQVMSEEQQKEWDFVKFKIEPQGSE